MHARHSVVDFCHANRSHNPRLACVFRWSWL